jgi:tyrosinase
VTVVARVQPRAVRATLKHRKSADKLSGEEVKRLREAIKAALRISDNRGYQFYAGWHGVPFEYCWHHHPLFLPWHRAYLYFFELSLQQIDPRVTLPWWDWSALSGIPPAYRSGALGSAPIKPFTSVRGAGWPKRTFREEGPKPGVPPLPYRSAYEFALAAPSFTTLNERITQIHDTIHVWVGGTMSDPAWAAYDPLFWAHHCMVDRAWRIWQHNHPGALPPALYLNQPLRPRAITVREVLDVKALGYDYAQSASSVAGTR